MSFMCEKCQGSGRQRISEMSTVTEPCQACGGLGVQDLERLLGEIARVLGKELIQGYAMPEKEYYKGNEWRRDEGKDYFAGAYEKLYERQVRVYLRRAPRGSRPAFLLVEKKEKSDE